MQVVVFWRRFKGTSFFGESGNFPPPLANHGYVLLERLRTMPRAAPLGYEEACRMVQREIQQQARRGLNDRHTKGHSNWIRENWPQWLAAQGFHVELSGDEYEIVPLHPVAA